MRMGICSVRIMGGPLMGAVFVLGSPRLSWIARKLVRWRPLELVLLSFLQRCLRDCSLFGLMRTGGRELELAILLGNYSKYMFV